MELDAYLLKVKLPRDNQKYLRYLKEKLIPVCVENEVECVIEHLNGKIIIFSTPQIIEYLKKLKNLRAIYRVEIFESYNALLQAIKKVLNGKNSFAVISKSRTLAEMIGEELVRELGIAVNLKNPEIRVEVEKKGKYYILYRENIYLKDEN